MIKLFDSLSHPTLSGTWVKGEVSTFSQLGNDLSARPVSSVPALWELREWGITPAESYIKACRQNPSLIPVAGFDPGANESVAGQIALVKRLGFEGIKIHPRFSGPELSSPLMEEVFRNATEQGLPIFLCTYHHGPVSKFPDADPFFLLIHVLKRVPEARVVLVHGGDVQVLFLLRGVGAFLIRICSWISPLTLMKYRGSSVDDDLRFPLSKLRSAHLAIRN